MQVGRRTTDSLWRTGLAISVCASRNDRRPKVARDISKDAPHLSIPFSLTVDGDFSPLVAADLRMTTKKRIGAPARRTAQLIPQTPHSVNQLLGVAMVDFAAQIVDINGNHVRSPSESKIPDVLDHHHHEA